jgi:hypothetical protein
MSVDTGCTETWIAVANKLALVPGRRGEVVSMNGLGAIKDRRTLQHRIAISIGVANDVYCFDGRGKGTIVTLDINGLITVGEKFICAGIVDPMNAVLVGTTIYIACRNEDVYSFTTTTQVTTRISRNHNDVLTSVVDADTITKLRNNSIYARLFGGATVGGTDYFIGNGAIHTSTNRIVDSRIRADGVCTPVGSDGTQFIKSCPSRNSAQWVTGNVVSSEIFGLVGSGGVAFAPSNGTSNEVPLTDYGGGMYSPDEPLDSIPAPTYSSVTVSITGAPIIPDGFADAGRGGELNGVHTLTPTTVNSNIISLTKVVGDWFITLALRSNATPTDLTANVALDQICSSVAPHLYYASVNAGIGATSWTSYDSSQNGYPVEFRIGAIRNDAQYKAWPPYPATCPTPVGTTTIVSWNR